MKEINDKIVAEVKKLSKVELRTDKEILDEIISSCGETGSTEFEISPQFTKSGLPELIDCKELIIGTHINEIRADLENVAMENSTMTEFFEDTGIEQSPENEDVIDDLRGEVVSLDGWPTSVDRNEFDEVINNYAKKLLGY